MERTRSTPERWLIIGISLLVVLIAALLAALLAHDRERERTLMEAKLDLGMRTQAQELNLVFNTYAWTLQGEGTALEAVRLNNDSVLARRWTDLLRNRYAIREVTLADDGGSTWSLHRSDSAWQFIVTRRHGGNAETLSSSWPSSRNWAVPVPSNVPPGTDPREHGWFSRAVEAGQGRPVWKESSNCRSCLNLSMLLHPGAPDSNLRILNFRIDAGLLLSGETSWEQGSEMVLLGTQHRPITTIDSTAAGRAWAHVLAERKQDRGTAPFQAEVDGRRWVGRIAPLYLDGATLGIGLLTDAEQGLSWARDQRLIQWSAAAALVLLGLLLALLSLQSRRAARKAMQQTRRSDLQARSLARAISEKETLDREVHHRVKNNLQVVSSLLNLQAQRVADEGAHREFLRGKRRIDSIALVHHKLYRQQNLAAVDLHVFLDDIAKAVAGMFAPQSSTVSHSVESNGLTCDADTAIQLGILLCELLANCHQHAFPYSTGGHIHIAVRRQEDGAYVLSVKDNGRGFDPADVKDVHLGLEVVEALAGQLDGHYRITGDAGGTLVEVDFRTSVPH
ncbi:MAG: sensor histidine kinase [Bacteroidetes bacterium]|nr:sensor histidine kinase [Bacteroidota bacterium]MBS1944355.1 sensor histidine kinase [Bacteroidota bacterium]